MKNIFIQKNTKQKGFTLLFAVLVSTLVVSIGATIISIALRQTILSGTTRESQYAFYAANTILECAHYWDTTNKDLNGKLVFPVDGIAQITDTDIEAQDVTCADVNIITGSGNEINGGLARPMIEDGETGGFKFFLLIKDRANISGLLPYEYCAEAVIYKYDNESTITTTIEAKGYNTCDENNPRRVERGLVEQYQS
ncbi:MAG: hypothetical protein RLZZ517_87 [Candidatus Parcubacteria bacterium]|jgi:Tfp pilus assembly protein PilE